MNTKTAVIIASLTVAGCAGTSGSGTAPPFGGEDDVAYSQALWSALLSANLAGSDAVQGTPYEGQHPHGAVLQTQDATLDVYGHTGEVIVKRNYGGEGVSTDSVADDPGAFLKSVTVMYRRESGYDPDNENWFWAKYKPDGSLDTNPKGMQLAGRVAKGADKGCIACHSGAPGGDYVFNNDRF